MEMKQYFETLKMIIKFNLRHIILADMLCYAGLLTKESFVVFCFALFSLTLKADGSAAIDNKNIF